MLPLQIESGRTSLTETLTTIWPVMPSTVEDISAGGGTMGGVPGKVRPHSILESVLGNGVDVWEGMVERA